MTVAAELPARSVRVLLFGALRDRLRCAEMVVREPVSTVAELWDVVTRQRPDVAAVRHTVRCARNLDYCGWDAPVTMGDEVAFMPPVCGGAGDRSAAVSVTLTDAPIDVSLVLEQAGDAGDGAVACFIGRVRKEAEGGTVHRLDYEAYEPMALSEMRRIAEGCRRRHRLTTVTLVHRLGALRVGEVAIAVVTAAPHRAEAFDGCREVVESVKSEVPIWKREHVAAGARWVDARHV
jgi:molybdopterin synthase catalytic subunit/molybdopterin converting factor small subunit